MSVLRCQEERGCERLGLRTIDWAISVDVAEKEEGCANRLAARCTWNCREVGDGCGSKLV